MFVSLLRERKATSPASNGRSASSLYQPRRHAGDAVLDTAPSGSLSFGKGLTRSAHLGLDVFFLYTCFGTLICTYFFLTAITFFT